MIINNTNKVLFTSYMCNENDDIVQTILRKWKELNPSFKIFYFSDDDIDVFFKNTEVSKIMELSILLYKKNILIYHILY